MCLSRPVPSCPVLHSLRSNKKYFILSEQPGCGLWSLMSAPREGERERGQRQRQREGRLMDSAASHSGEAVQASLSSRPWQLIPRLSSSLTSCGGGRRRRRRGGEDEGCREGENVQPQQKRWLWRGTLTTGVITVECEDTAAPRDASLTLTPLQLAVGLVLQRPPLTLHPRRGLTVRQLLLSLRLCTVNEKKSFVIVRPAIISSFSGLLFEVIIA